MYDLLISNIKTHSLLAYLVVCFNACFHTRFSKNPKSFRDICICYIHNNYLICNSLVVRYSLTMFYLIFHGVVLCSLFLDPVIMSKRLSHQRKEPTVCKAEFGSWSIMSIKSHILASDGPDRDRYGFVSFSLTYSSFKWYYGM